MINENEFLFHALIMGIFITFIYDLLRIFRRVVPHNSFFVSAEDLLFWVYCGGEVFLLMYHESDGTLRWFAVLGALVGMFFYKRYISPVIVTYVSGALNRLLKFMKKMLDFLCRPLRFLFRKTGSAVHRTGQGMGKFVRRRCRWTKNKLTYFMKMLKMAIRA